MKSLKGTQTEKNLIHAFAGESQARMRYTYFASKAKKDGFVQIADIFEETANQEKEHAKRFFKFLEGGMVEVSGKFPAGVIGSTAENLKAAAAGEHEEWSADYPAFADIAAQVEAAGIGRQALILHRKRHGLQEGRKSLVALPQLRLHLRSVRGADAVPGVRASAGALRAARGKLVILFGSFPD